MARLHVSEATAFEFKPSGFDVFPEMARVYGEIAKRLASGVLSRTHTTRFADSFIGQETEVSKFVSTIWVKTDMKPIRVLAVYGDSDKARLKEVDAQATTLKSSSPKELIESLKLAKSDIALLVGKIQALAAVLSSDRSLARTELSREAKERTAAAALLGTKTFKRPFFRAVGTPQWEAFAKAVHTLARAEADSYPDATDRCLLCEQPLNPDARAHVAALLSFVGGDAQREAEKATRSVDAEVGTLRGLDINIFSTESVVRAHLHRLEHPCLPSPCSNSSSVTTL
jgi:hypothetical protein